VNLVRSSRVYCKVQNLIVSQLKIKMEWFKIKSEKNHDLLVVNNFIHRVDRIRDKTEYYKCIQNCGGRAILKKLKNKTDVILSKPHCHPTHGVELANRGFRNKLKVSTNLVMFKYKL